MKAKFKYKVSMEIISDEELGDDAFEAGFGMTCSPGQLQNSK